MRRLIIFLFAIATALQSMAVDNSAKYRYLYIEAARQMDMGHYTQAFELFRQCHAIRPDAAETCFSLAKLYQYAGKDSLATSLVKRASMLAPDNVEFAERLAGGYLNANQLDSAAVVLERLSVAHPDRTDYLSVLQRIYENTAQYDRLLSVLNRYELQEGSSEDVILSKTDAYIKLGDMQGAYKEIKGLVDRNPYDLEYKVLMGNWLLTYGREQEALKTYSDVLKEEPDNVEGQIALMDYYRGKGRIKAVDSLLCVVLQNPRATDTERARLLSQWIKDDEQKGGDSVKVMEMFNRMLKLPQSSPDVAKMRVAYLMLKQAPKDSLRSAWEEVLRIAPEDVEARVQIISMLWQDSIDENVIRECKKAIEYIPNEPLLYYHLGVAQYINKHNTEAIATLRRGIGTITAETKPAVAADLFAMLGDILQKEGDKEGAYAAYDSSLVYNPDNVMCLNNYAYFLSLDNRDLKKAEKMSYRAITAAANNGTYLDTYAWILYQQGRYEDARVYIEMAIKCEQEANKDSTMAADSVVVASDILDHAGDIYLKLNRRNDALRMWDAALKNDPEDEAVLRKKIKKNRK